MTVVPIFTDLTTDEVIVGTAAALTVIDPLPRSERPASFDTFHVKAAVPGVLPTNFKLLIVDDVNVAVPVNAFEPFSHTPQPVSAGIISIVTRVPL